MKKRRFLKFLLTALASLILLLVLVVLFWLGPTVRYIAESIGSKALGTPLVIDSLSINPRKGTVDIHAFDIRTHDGFSKTNTWQLARFHLALDMRSLFSDTIIINEIRIESPYFTYENSKTTDNISELIASIQDFAGIDPDAPPKEKTGKKPAKKEDSAKEPRKVIVEQLVINDLRLQLAHTENPDLDVQLGFEQFSLSFTNGAVQLKNLSISDPGRLTTPNLIKLQGIDVLFDPATIYSTNVVIEHVRISSPHLFLENNPQASTIAELVRLSSTFTNRFAKADSDVVEEEPAAVDAAATKTPVTVELHDFSIEDVKVFLLDTYNYPEAGSKTLASIERFAVNLAEGTIQLKSLAVGNPGPLVTPNVFELEGIELTFDPASIRGTKPVITDVQIIKPRAFLEHNQQTDTTAEFIKLVDSFIAQLPERTAPAAPPEQKPAEPPESARDAAPPLELHNLFVDDIQLRLLDTSGTNSTHEMRTVAAIGGISLKPEEGSAQISGITIPSPDGFTAGNIFHLANIDIEIEPGSIFSRQVIINDVFVNSPLVNLEQTETRGNVSELIQALKGFAPPPKDAPPGPGPTVAAVTEEPVEPVPLAGQPVVLRNLSVTNFMMNMIIPAKVNARAMGFFGGANTNTPPKELKLDGNPPAPLLAFAHLSVKPLDGKIQIDQLSVGNPQGFANSNLMSLVRFSVDIDPETLQAETMIIKEVLLDKPRVTYELKFSTDNIKALQASITAAIERRKERTEEPEPATAESGADEAAEAAGQKVIVEHVLVKDGMVKAKISALPTAPIPLPDIELNDIGKDGEGTSLGDAASLIGKTLYDTIVGSVFSVTGFAGDALKGAGSFTMGVLGMGNDDAKETIDPASEIDDAPPAKEAPPKKKSIRRKRRINGKF